MRTVLLARDGLVARYLAHELVGGAASAGSSPRPTSDYSPEDHTRLVDAIVVETGREARRRKLRREWRRTPWWRTPLLVVDLMALAVYGRMWSRALRRHLDGHPALKGWPEGVPVVHVDDANDQECLDRLRALAPDAMIVLGTSILKPAVLEIPARVALNVHGGIVPGYRNVHSEVWAVLNDDAGSVGTSILHLDEGIDSGAIALQETVPAAERFFELRWQNVVLAARLAREALERHRDGRLAKTGQDAASAGFHPTPGASELVRLAYRCLRRSASSSSRS